MNLPSWLTAAQHFFQQGNLDAALATLESGLTETPTCVDAWELKGRILQALHRYSEAAAANQEALNWMQNGVPNRGITSLVTNADWFNAGYASFDVGDWKTAISCFDRALAIDPSIHEAWFNRGLALSNIRSYEEAFISFDQALKIEFNDDQAWYNKGVILGEFGRYEEAIAAYNQAIAINPVNSSAFYNRSITLGKLEKHEEALASWDEMLKSHPNNYRAWYDRGVTLHKLGRHADEIQSYDQALRIKSDIDRAWYNRGTALFELELYEDAIASIDKAIAIKPNYYKAWFNRGHAAAKASGSNIQSVEQNLPPEMRIPMLDQRGYHGFLASLYEGLKYVQVDADSEGWSRLHLAIGAAHFSQSKLQENPRPYWRDAIRSYETAHLVLTGEAFPEVYLEVLQGLIQAHLALKNVAVARMYQQQGMRVFEELRAKQPNRLKPAFEAKFSSFSQSEIDLLVGENNPKSALEQAEFYKNRCLTWILDEWQETVLSPSYEEMQQLCSVETAIVYWHLSLDSLTTFIIRADEACPIVLESDRYKQAQQFETWRKDSDADYRDYASKKGEAAQERQQHPWRVNLENRIARLKEILQIDAICQHLPNSVQNVILVPHRDLHRFPIHALFPEQLTCHYLPSMQIGLNRRNVGQDKSHLSLQPLLNADDPQTKQREMPYAQLESAIVRHLVETATQTPATHIPPHEAAINSVLNALQHNHSIFHFTGHAAHNSRKPEESALALTDGLLTAKQISHLDLAHCNLVCLASCETALTGKDGIATEYVGLGSVFLKAGAANVLSTLWQVDELSSCWFVIHFYENLLTGESPALALKHTQQWLCSCTVEDLINWIKELARLERLSFRWSRELAVAQDEGFKTAQGKMMEPDDHPYEHPFYWAGFILTGGV